MAMPIRMAISNPGRMRPSDTSMNLSASVPDSVIVAGTQRSILPGPSVMTNIWPIPTITEKAAKVRAACDRPKELAPPVNMTVTIQTAAVAANDQIHGFFERDESPFIGFSPAFRDG